LARTKKHIKEVGKVKLFVFLHLSSCFGRSEKPEHFDPPRNPCFHLISGCALLHLHIRHAAARGATRAVKDIYLVLDVLPIGICGSNVSFSLVRIFPFLFFSFLPFVHVAFFFCLTLPSTPLTAFPIFSFVANSLLQLSSNPVVLPSFAPSSSSRSHISLFVSAAMLKDSPSIPFCRCRVSLGSKSRI